MDQRSQTPTENDATTWQTQSKHSLQPLYPNGKNPKSTKWSKLPLKSNHFSLKCDMPNPLENLIKSVHIILSNPPDENRLTPITIIILNQKYFTEWHHSSIQCNAAMHQELYFKIDQSFLTAFGALTWQAWQQKRLQPISFTVIKLKKFTVLLRTSLTRCNLIWNNLIIIGQINKSQEWK